MSRRDSGEAVIWITIAAIGIYLASQWTGWRGEEVSKAPASASDKTPKKRLFPLFPRKP